MTIVSQTFGVLGQTGVMPRRVQLVVTSSYSALTAPGYLQFAGINTNQVTTTDIFDIIYSYNLETATGTYGEFTPVFSTEGIITLIAVSSGSISVPVSGADGGTGISNVNKTITLGGNFSTVGAYNLFLTLTGLTNVTLPTTGTLATTNQVLSPVNQSSTPVTAATGNLYVTATNPQCVITLPAVAAFGSNIGVMGQGSGGWQLRTAAGQSIKILGTSASTSVTSASANDCIFVMCVVANTTWVAYSFDTAGFTII